MSAPVELDRQYTPIDGLEWCNIILEQLRNGLVAWDIAISPKAVDAIIARIEWLMHEGSDLLQARVYDQCSHAGKMTVWLEEDCVKFECDIKCKSDIGWADGAPEVYEFAFIAMNQRLMFDGRVTPDSDLLTDYEVSINLAAAHPDDQRLDFDMPLPTPVLVGNQIVDRPVKVNRDAFIQAKQEQLGVQFNSVEIE